MSFGLINLICQQAIKHPKLLPHPAMNTITFPIFN